ncbi:hypothetical protein H5410_006896 [Solanum commersonii]|uniref:ATP synthase YMF19 uncharacterized C-terminal domain-containing protein n=1 Tax=Solanum commersonii TaxID=4109 RepID=A0A9J6AAE5_SOLCO|nr:hypothetical protein H5410_006896 [Solanum commersonii]
MTLISCFGKISGSRGMERNIFYLISKSVYSNPGWVITFCPKEDNLFWQLNPHGVSLSPALWFRMDPDWTKHEDLITD